MIKEKVMDNTSYDLVILPVRTFTRNGIEDYISVAKSFSSKMLVLYNNAKFETI